MVITFNLFSVKHSMRARPSAATRALHSSSRPRRLIPALLGALACLGTGVQAAPIDVDIPPQNLAQALHQLGRQANLQVLYSQDLVDGQRSPAVQGRMEPAEALERLLKGRNIRYSIQHNTVTLTPMPLTATLPAISVVGALPDSDTYVATGTTAGTKTDTPLIEIPQSISVVTAAQIREQNPQTLGDAVRYTPGIVVQEGFNRTDDPFIIRGFDVRTNPGVMFRDGLKIPLPHYSAMSEPYALERIEVVKGPASVLYGQASPGGIVNVVSKRPTDSPLRELQLSGGSHSNRQLAGDFGGRIDDEGRLTYRLTGLARNADTMIDHVPDDRYYLAPALTWRISPDTSLTLLASYMKNKTINNAGYPLEGTVKYNPNGRIPRHRFTGEPDWSKWDQEVANVGYQFAHRFNDTWQFKQNLGYAQSRNRVNHAYWWTWVPGSDFSTAERGAYRRDDDAHGVSIDNQFEATWQSGRFRHNTLFGLDYTETSFTRKQYAGYNNLAPIDFFDPAYGSDVLLPAKPDTYTNEKRSQLGLYLQDQIKFDDKLVVVLSGRYDNADGSTLNKLSGVNTRTGDNAFTWRTGLLYLADNGLAPYISYSTSFQPQAGTTSPARGTTPFDPTKGKQWEAGVKYQPNGSNSFITASVFELTRTNVPTTDPANPVYSVQEGEVRSRGLELSATANLASGWNLIAAYTYTDAEITKSNSNTLGNTPEAVPRNMASLWSDYTVPSGALAGLNIGAGVRYMGSTYNNTNAAKVGDYTVFDAALRYDFGARSPSLKGWTADLTVRNLFDKDYVASCTYACFYGEGRTVLGRVTYKW
ncbi:TonB-dependent siderophore receptor [Bordetella bronchiseptica]|nr:TonB-dependent siderophore receptor [Bordetella bronchiseptica]AWP76648.1 TonB-dependent siderophore receptor [Bordetella bronchiseptica]AWP81497.1 TonB-dependent siderophore receptor [Bordetella bronchiseptica]AZW14175.1 TonB-dependent siderophore receptor [Bordetella bronchiseptica]AZW23481.1 TonB-dependent siderophore receptor [Bordetella bronchiseptica]KDC82529.1 putative ferrichrome-iron receptor FhuA [Bordetella bronchiseptica MBORD665]